jgi:hypothetical protein
MLSVTAAAAAAAAAATAAVSCTVVALQQCHMLSAIATAAQLMLLPLL